MDDNQKLAIVALIVAVILILVAIGLFIYEIQTAEFPSFDIRNFGIALWNRILELWASHDVSPSETPLEISISPTFVPQIQSPEASPSPAAGQSSTGSSNPIPKEPEYKSVFFGRYEQGKGEEPIEWYVLEQKKDSCLLVSRYAIDLLKYHGAEEPVTWEKCGLRGWLNCEFLDIAFNPGERAAILVTEVDNSVGNKIFGIDGGNNTEDSVFLLSREEAEAYFPIKEERRCEPTSPIRSAAIGGYSNWWLRSPGTQESCADYVSSTGGFISGRVDLKYTAIRPVMWVKSDSISID